MLAGDPCTGTQRWGVMHGSARNIKILLLLITVLTAAAVAGWREERIPLGRHRDTTPLTEPPSLPGSPGAGAGMSLNGGGGDLGAK